MGWMDPVFFIILDLSTYMNLLELEKYTRGNRIPLPFVILSICHLERWNTDLDGFWVLPSVATLRN